MKTKALQFVIFTISLFAFGVLVTTIFNTSPSTIDAVVMLYSSLLLVLFGVIYFALVLFFRLYSHVTEGQTTQKLMLRLSLVISLFILVLLALQEQRVLSWEISIILGVAASIVGVIMKRRKSK